MSEDRIEIRVKLEPKQVELFNAINDPDTRIIISEAGRGSGKTKLAAIDILQFGSRFPESPFWAERGIKKPTRMVIVGPDYKRTRRIYSELIETFPDAIANNAIADKILTLRGGASVQCISNENMGSVRGDEFDRAYLDEAADISVYGYDHDLEPAIARRDGKAILTTTPHHGKRNWTHQMWQAAKDGKLEAGYAHHMSWSDNSYLNVKAYLRIKNRLMAGPMGKATWEEEYEAIAQDESSRWLDSSHVIYTDKEKVPPGLFICAILDTAWGKPDGIDPSTRTRKDNSVINITGQDHASNVYILDGLCEKYIQPEPYLEALADFCVLYGVKRIFKETTGENDGFGELWRMFLDRRFANNPSAKPQAVLVRRTRGANWKYEGIRTWSSDVLDRGKFHVVREPKEGVRNPLIEPLQDELANYNEADAKRDKVHDDVLVTCADVKQPEIWQGQSEIEVIKGEKPWLVRTIFEREQEDIWMNEEMASKRSII